LSVVGAALCNRLPDSHNSDRNDAGDETHTKEYKNSDTDLAACFVADEPRIKVTKFQLPGFAAIWNEKLARGFAQGRTTSALEPSAR
jgi:hypothetical protein